jgi:hypothetical protein
MRLRAPTRAESSGVWKGLCGLLGPVAEPRQICWLPYIADMIRAALEFVGGEC